MTFSIVARSADGALHGVAVASKFLSVGAVVPWAEAGVGALATQAFANLGFGPQGLALMRTGCSADDTVAGLIAADPGREERQVGVVDGAGAAATYTGEGCHDWAGGHAGDGFAVQGNILAGPTVVEAMRDRWLEAESLPFSERLVAALLAGDRAGGDRRGRQSAALYVVGKKQGYGGTSDVAVDLRADDHPDPVVELGRLLGLHTLYFGKAAQEDLIPLDGAVAEEVGGLLSRIGYESDGTPAGLEQALGTWAGIANLEERLSPHHIDPLVLDQLRGEASGRE